MLKVHSICLFYLAAQKTINYYVCQMWSGQAVLEINVLYLGILSNYGCLILRSKGNEAVLSRLP